jgi:hypothetical protein
MPSIRQNLKTSSSHYSEDKRVCRRRRRPELANGDAGVNNLMGAFERVAEQFGYEIHKPVKKTTNFKTDHRTI